MRPRRRPRRRLLLLLLPRRSSSTKGTNERAVPPHKDEDATGRGTQSPCPFFSLPLRMKVRNRFPVLAAAAFALSIVAGGCAEETSPPRPQPAGKAVEGTGKSAAPKPHVKLFTGKIEAMDPASGTLTLKGPKGEMRFQAHEKVRERLDGLKIGDKVILKHVDEIVLSIVKIRTSRDALDRKEKEGAVIDAAPVPQSQSK